MPTSFWREIMKTFGAEGSVGAGAQLQWIIDQANDWRGSVGYINDMARRIAYVDGSMATDMELLLNKLFPKLTSDLKDQLIMFKVARMIVEKKAILFRGKGKRFLLKDQAGEELEVGSPGAENFDAMIRESSMWRVLRKVNKYVETCNECGIRIWWDGDPDTGHVRLSVYPPHQAHVGINPDKPWSLESAIAVALEKTGHSGPRGNSKRFEVWGDSMPEPDRVKPDSAYEIEQSALSTERDKTSYGDLGEVVVSGTSAYEVFNEQENPYMLDGKPIYPIVWFKNYDEDIYSNPGDDTLVRLNRALNVSLTWMKWGMDWQVFGVPVLEFDATVGAQAKEKLKNFVLSPKNAVDLPPGVSLRFESPGFTPEPFTNTLEMMIQYTAMMDHLPPKSINISEGLPQSGAALRIEFAGLSEYRGDQVDVYRRDVERALTVAVVVHNANCAPGRRIPEGMRACWQEGIYHAAPVDSVELAQIHEAKIPANVSSPVAWVMEEQGTTRADAEAMIEEYREDNARYLDTVAVQPAPDVEDAEDGDEEEEDAN